MSAQPDRPQAPAADPGLYGPDSVTWRVHAVAATAAGLAFRSGLLVVPDALRAGPHLRDARRRLAELPGARP